MTLSEFDIWYRTRFRRTSSSLTATAFVISDILGVMLSIGWGFFWINLYDLDIINFKSFVMYWPYLPAFILIFYFLGLYPGVSLAPAEELKRFTIGSFMAFGGIIMSRYIENGEWDAITAAFIVSCVFTAVIVLLVRSLTHWLLYKTNLGGISAVIFGSGNTGKLVVDCLLDSITTGYVPVLILDDDPGGIDEYRGIPIIHDTSIGPEIVKRYRIKMAMMTMSKLESKNPEYVINHSLAAFRYTALFPDFLSATNIWMSVRDFGGVLGFVASNQLRMGWNLRLKRCLDLAAVCIGGILVLPFLLLVALLIKMTSPGPVLYRHKRIGKNGKHFNVYKFRSMVIDSQERLQKLLESDPALRKEWEDSHKLHNDPRVTGIGKFLRRTSIDEFPQLINILKGEMSLVGPRPIVDDEIKKYGDDYTRVFSVTPGLTGLWQISGRSDTDYNARIAFDTYYLQSWSVWLDFWVLLMTFSAVVRGRGAY